MIIFSVRCTEAPVGPLRPFSDLVCDLTAAGRLDGTPPPSRKRGYAGPRTCGVCTGCKRDKACIDPEYLRLKEAFKARKLTQGE